MYYVNFLYKTEGDIEYIFNNLCERRNIETTWRYDHTSDRKVRDHFNQIKLQNVENLTSNDKARVLLDNLLSK